MIMRSIDRSTDSFWVRLQKSAETTGDQDLHYDGRITDVAIDGSVDYKNRPADKERTGRWTAVSFIMGMYTWSSTAFQTHFSKL